MPEKTVERNEIGESKLNKRYAKERTFGSGILL